MNDMAVLQKAPNYLDTAAVAKRLRIAIVTVYKHRSAGRLPPPDAVFGRSPVWLPETINQYIAGLSPRANVRREWWPV